MSSQGYSAAVGVRNPEASSAHATSQAGGRDHRGADRFDLSDASGSLIHNGNTMPCLIFDISLTGCCVRTSEPFTAGSLEPVKVVFPIFEMILSIWGITQWVRGEHLLGIQFCHPTARSKNQLAGLLTCLIDSSAAEVVKKAIAEIAADQEDDPIIQLEHPPAPPPSRKPEPGPEPEPEPEPELELGPVEAAASSTPPANTSP